jgi:hypothetical protein
MGASKESTLLWNYEHVIKALDFEFTDIDE